MIDQRQRARVVMMMAGLAALPLLARADDIQPGVVAKVQASPNVLNLRTGDVNTTLLPDALLGDAFVPGQFYVLMLDGPMTPDRRVVLVAAGVSLRGYLPTNGFMAEVSNATPQGLRALGFVQRAVAYDASWTVAPELLAGARVRAFQTPERQALASKDMVVASLWLFEQEPAAPALAALNALQGVKIDSVDAVGPSTVINITLPANQAFALTTIPGLQLAEPVSELGGRSNNETRWVLQSNVSGVRPLYTRGLTGTGQIIGVIDGRVDVNHCSFSDPSHPIGATHRKILAYNTAQGSDRHGTHVAGTLLGDGGVDNSNTRGVAYNAKLVYNYYPSFPTDGFQRFTLHASQGAAVHSNSWGTLDYVTDYDGLSRSIDQVSHDSDDNLIVFAVGNTFPTVANPENAKNCLAVTASGSPPNQDQFCYGSPMPTIDGRRKPEVAGPGCAIFSSAFSTTCSTLLLEGTSMATPGVSGTVALMRQYFMSGFYPSGAAVPTDAFTPSGALLRAMAVNSAVDMSGLAGFPSAYEGWGRMLADNSVYFAGDARRLVLRDVRNASGGALSTGQSAQIAVQSLQIAGNPLQSFKVTLAYADAPAAVSATFTPVNDLNLVVTAPDGTEYLGNVFNAGESSSGGTADTLNNLEQVLISSPMDGRWTIRVDAAAVNAGAQGYALVVTGAVSELPACIGDFDNSGGTPDSADIDAFFNAWLAGNPAADVDLSGGTPDSADIDTFFTAWLSGC